MTTELNNEKPFVQLSGQDGNAFAIIGACRKAARGAGWDKDRISDVVTDMMSGDYNNLLRVAVENFDVA